MKCKKIREILMTDYIDGEIDTLLKTKVEDHIKGCKGCFMAKNELEANISAPLRGAELIKPPEELWHKIKDAIEEEVPTEKNFEITNVLRELFIARRPAMVAVTAIALFLVIGGLTRSHYVKKDMLNSYFAEQVEFVDSLNNGDNGFYETFEMLNDDFII